MTNRETIAAFIAARASAKIGDKVHVRCDGRSYMECTIERVEDDIAYCTVEWATIIAISYRCHVSQIDQRGVVNHGMSERVNINAPRLFDEVTA